ncbi:signal transduction histidine kinase [Arcanobacterium pluranimalium]|uniref:sensor histidine kinase n=1 Tax=Arcanobacterium pluranimalium TaxID=108028 RepID=UPI00195DB36C|nr:HAMP domain-containing sensor histidine kinase [Arcanobacterium pluranimalium]MBM7825010.1 signal transduction histidine kinase [Arcanobacterium pluranimalium]
MMVLTALLVMLVLVILASQWRSNRDLHREVHQLKERNDYLEKRPAMISHEIRTPLSLVQGAAELLAEETPGPLNDLQRSFIETISENSRQAIDIAENFLIDLNMDTRPLQLQEIDIRAIVADTAKEIRKIFSIRIDVDAAGGLLPIHADKQLIRQLIWNLINNAARHAHSEHPIIVRIENGEGSGAHISITDRGGGMNNQDLEKLFTPFSSGSTRRPGSGIGMMVSKKIVDVHHGKILVDSAEGIGTVIHILLPQHIVESKGPQ